MTDIAAPYSGASLPHAFPPDSAPAANRARIMIVSSVRLFRDGLALLAARAGTWDSVVVACNLDEVRARLTAAQPTVALIDAADASTLDLARFLARSRTIVGVIAFAATDDVDGRLLLAEAGVSGYISRDGSMADVMDAVERARAGELDCSPRMSAALARRLAKLAHGDEIDGRAELLSYREREIVRLIDTGMSNKEISRTLHIEVATVKNHIHHILHKLGVHRRGEAAAILRRWYSAVAARHADYAPTLDRK
jgi:two-component system nitrate/nitrite response regulator NarL